MPKSLEAEPTADDKPAPASPTVVGKPQPSMPAGAPPPSAPAMQPPRDIAIGESPAKERAKDADAFAAEAPTKERAQASALAKRRPVWVWLAVIAAIVAALLWWLLA